MAQIEVIRGDITAVDADVIVNAANTHLRPGGGVDGAIRAAGGPSITEETAKIGPVEVGQAVATTAGDLPARWVIHTVGPVWGSVPAADADRLLASCYQSSLTLAQELGASSIAFPGISTGIYGFPPQRAGEVATKAVSEWLGGRDGSVQKVTYVCFDETNYRIYTELLGT